MSEGPEPDSTRSPQRKALSRSLQANGLDPAVVEQVVVGGDLSRLTPAQRVAYYRAVCASLGL